MKGDFTRRTFDPTRHATSVRKQQGRVDLDADWNEQQDIDEHLRLSALADIVGAAGAPIDDAAFAVTFAGTDVRLSPGRYYVAGQVCENDADVSLFDQPDLPAGTARIVRSDGTWVAAGDAVPAALYLAYIDVWPQHRSVIEDPALREVALGGPDTATRVRTVWQVRLVQAGAAGDRPPCTVTPPAWAALTTPSTGTLAAWAKPLAAPTSDCDVPLAAPYRGLDNRQYRVEIHDGGTPGSATYVWSRDNGSVAVTWSDTTGSVVTVKSPGRDGSSGFSVGDWVELTDDTRELLGVPGTLVRLTGAQGDQLEVDTMTATGTLDHTQFPRHPRVRRWDGIGTVPAGGGDIELELGVQVRFGTGAETYRSGDFWSFPARAATHDVEWPKVGTTPADMTPHGPLHRYGRLALVAWDGTTWTLVCDCRPLFAPLADQVDLFYVGGDAQEVLPVVGSPTTLVPTALPLVVGVAAGDRPVAGATVEFTVTVGSGTLGGPAQVTTGADGLASATWSVDSGTAVQEVTARLLDADRATSKGLPVRFSAWLQRADLESYDPTNSPSLAGAVTVQQAIDRLAAITGGGCATLTLSPGDGWQKALEELPASSDAVVCFRPGEYRADTAVVLSRLGSVAFHGGGPATRITIAMGEAALVFDRCRAVSVCDLAVSVEQYPGDPQKNLRGVVTAVGCANVAVSRVELSCPAASQTRAACVTVRGGGPANGDTGAATVTSVLVEDCSFAVGHAQVGVLVVDADHVVVRGCRLAVTQLPENLSFATLMADPVRRARVVDQLLGHAVLDRSTTAAPSGGFNTAVPVGGFVARLNSTVPEAQWRQLAADHPPTEADVASPQGVQAYVQRLSTAAVEQPATLPAFDHTVQQLRAQLGPQNERIFETDQAKTLLSGLLTGGAIDVQPASAITKLRRGVTLPAQGGSVKFDSPLGQNTWEAVLAVAPPAQQTPVSLLRAMRAAANKMVTDPAFGETYAGAFLKQLAGRLRSTGARAIVVGGRTIGVAELDNNEIDGFAEGCHVAGSIHGPKGKTRVIATSVRVRGNDVALTVPLELAAAPRAVFVGNAHRVVVVDNDVRVNWEGNALTGVRLEGEFGPHLVVRDNVFAGCARGVTVRQHGPAPTQLLWVAADNLNVGAPPSVPAVDAPPQVRATGNVP